MLEGQWPSSISKGRLLWRNLRNVIIGVAKFRKAIRRRSLSVYSNSGSEYDQISHASFDSFLEDEKGDAKHESIMKSDGHYEAGRVGTMTKGMDEVESTGKFSPQSLWFIDATHSVDSILCDGFIYLLIDGALCLSSTELLLIDAALWLSSTDLLLIDAAFWLSYTEMLLIDRALCLSSNDMLLIDGALCLSYTELRL